MFARSLLVLVILVTGTAEVEARRHFLITAAEKRACKPDAIRYCAYTYPNMRRMASCMERNLSKLGDNCRRVFEAGMKRRGL